MRARKTFVLVLLTIFAVTVGGCGSIIKEYSEISPRDIRILIGDNVDHFIRFHTFFEIDNDSTLNVTVFTDWDNISSINIFDIALLDDFVVGFNSQVLGAMTLSVDRTIINSGERVLSQRQLNNIWQLTETVITNGSDSDAEFEWMSHGSYVWAIIDGKMYWSFYDSDIKLSARPDDDATHYNDELLLLAYYLIDLSPIKVGYEMREMKNELWEQVK